MFAEDVGLLPREMFKRMLEQAVQRPAQFESMARQLFSAMAKQGGSIGFESVAWFNGGLFDSLDTYFAMARGTRGKAGGGLPALEMTKWFNTNYHYMVPEFTRGQNLTLASTKPVDEFREAKALGFHTRPSCPAPSGKGILLTSAAKKQRPLSHYPRSSQ